MVPTGASSKICPEMKNMANDTLKTYKKVSSLGLRPPKLERTGSRLNRSDMHSSLSRSFRGGFRRKGDDHPARQSSADEAHSMFARGGESGNISSASAGFGYDFSRVPAHASTQVIQLVYSGI